MKKQKTTKEHFESFSEPFRTQAIENADRGRLEVERETGIEALYFAFIWSLSPQGLDYWIDFKNSLKD